MDVVHRTVLQRLAEGGRFNVLHSTARALIAAGYAREEWGALTITEAGRIALRPRQIFHIDSAHVSNLDHACILSDDPMSNPQREPFELLPEAPMPLPAPPLPQEVELLEPTDDRKQLALRAAGVASGKTGVWVDEQWLMEFITALDAG